MTLEVAADLKPKTKRRKPVTPLDRSAAAKGYEPPSPTEQPPDPELLIDDPDIRRARAWCRRRFDELVWARAVWLGALASFGVEDRCGRMVALWVEATYMATEQAARVHRCPRRSRCLLCQTPAYDAREIERDPAPVVADRQQYLDAQAAYVSRHDEGQSWRQQVLDLTGVRLSPEEPDNEVWHLLQQVDYALECYKELTTPPSVA